MLILVVMVVAADRDSPQQSIPKNQQNGHHQVNLNSFLPVMYTGTPEHMIKDKKEKMNKDQEINGL